MRGRALLLTLALLAGLTTGCAKSGRPAAPPRAIPADPAPPLSSITERPAPVADATVPAGGARVPAPISEADCEIVGVGLGTAVDAVVERLGPYSKREFVTPYRSFRYSYDHLNLSLLISPKNSLVIGWSASDGHRTLRGIGPGDDRATVEAAYGEPSEDFGDGLRYMIPARRSDFLGIHLTQGQVTSLSCLSSYYDDLVPTPPTPLLIAPQSAAPPTPAAAVERILALDHAQAFRQQSATELTVEVKAESESLYWITLGARSLAGRDQQQQYLVSKEHGLVSALHPIPWPKAPTTLPVPTAEVQGFVAQLEAWQEGSLAPRQITLREISPTILSVRVQKQGEDPIESLHYYIDRTDGTLYVDTIRRIIMQGTHGPAILADEETGDLVVIPKALVSLDMERALTLLAAKRPANSADLFDRPSDLAEFYARTRDGEWRFERTHWGNTYNEILRVYQNGQAVGGLLVHFLEGRVLYLEWREQIPQ